MDNKAKEFLFIISFLKSHIFQIDAINFKEIVLVKNSV